METTKYAIRSIATKQLVTVKIDVDNKVMFALNDIAPGNYTSQRAWLVENKQLAINALAHHNGTGTAYNYPFVPSMISESAYEVVEIKVDTVNVQLTL